MQTIGYRLGDSKMFTENLGPEGHAEFSSKERAKAELYAWITGGYAVSSGAKKADSKITILSKDAINSYIRLALSDHDSIRAQELLDIASKPIEEPSESMVRKSIRVCSGEYVKLLYLKMKERTSFADVIMKVLHEPCKKAVEELAIEFSGKQPATNRIAHLLKVINSWESEKPDSRAHVADWGDWVKSSYRMLHPQEKHIAANEWDESQLTTAVDNRSFTLITPYYSAPVQEPKYLQSVKEAFSRLALTDLLIKASGDNLDQPISGIFHEFKEQWLKENEEEPFLKQVSLNAYIENNQKTQQISFSFYFQLSTFFEAEKEVAFFSKFGQETVNQFVDRVKLYSGATSDFLVNGKYEGITNSEIYQKHSSTYLGPHRFDITIGTGLELDCGRVTACSSEDFTEDWPEEMPILLSARKNQLEKALLTLAEKNGMEKMISRDKDYKSLAIEADYVIKKALDKATTPEDYREINNLLTLSNLWNDYRRILDFAQETIISTLNHHSVVSFYVNSDLWRIVPMILERTDWSKLVDSYLDASLSGQTEKPNNEVPR